jgi:glyoxylase-like metal-dependent hydrolase (beta-lactamase superfamily II)
MKETEITPDVVQLTRWRFVNAFLVREDDGFTLVDTTVGGGADPLIAAAERRGGAIRRVVLTHGHGDHVGSLDALKQRLGDALEVFLPDLDARILAGEEVADGKKRGSWPKLQTAPDVRLQGGERIGSLEVVPSPGHSPGHVAFLETRERTLLGGDVYTAYGKVSVSTHFYWRFPFAAMATWDRARDVESARALRALDPATLAVGHGPALRAPGAAMDRAIERAARALGSTPAP